MYGEFLNDKIWFCVIYVVLYIALKLLLREVKMKLQ